MSKLSATSTISSVHLYEPTATPGVAIDELCLVWIDAIYHQFSNLSAVVRVAFTLDSTQRRGITENARRHIQGLWHGELEWVLFCFVTSYARNNNNNITDPSMLFLFLVTDLEVV